MVHLIIALACASGPSEGEAARRARLRDRLFAELGDAYDQPLDGLVETDPQSGAEVFAKSCAGCHGAEGRGDGPRSAGMAPPPADLVGPGSRFFSDAAQVLIIREGSPGTGMPPWGRSLTEAQILDAYAWIRSRRAP